MSSTPDETKEDDDAPVTMFAWMARLHNPDTGEYEHVVMCATLPGQPPNTMASPNLYTAMALRPIMQQAANALRADISLHAFDGGRVLSTLTPQLVQPVDSGNIVVPPRHH